MDRGIQSLEKLISCLLIQEDAETIYSLMTTIKDSIFSLAIDPYIALFVHECQAFFGENYLEGDSAKQIKDIRNYIKAFDVGLGKSRRRVDAVDAEQDVLYRSQLRFDFMKNLDMHYNLGVFFTENMHIVGNSQMCADFLGVKTLDEEIVKEKMIDMGKQMGGFVAQVKTGLSQVVKVPKIELCSDPPKIKYYYDLNTNKENYLFRSKDKIMSLFCLNLLCSMNFVRYVLV